MMNLNQQESYMPYEKQLAERRGSLENLARNFYNDTLKNSIIGTEWGGKSEKVKMEVTQDHECNLVNVMSNRSGNIEFSDVGTGYNAHIFEVTFYRRKFMKYRPVFSIQHEAYKMSREENQFQDELVPLEINREYSKITLKNHIKEVGLFFDALLDCFNEYKPKFKEFGGNIRVYVDGGVPFNKRTFIDKK